MTQGNVLLEGRDEDAAEWRELLDDGLHNLSCAPNVNCDDEEEENSGVQRTK
jgi:hypothetical protein